jgi:hypothetical protein
MALTITTNNVPRDLLSGWDLTERERKELDYVAPVDDSEAWGNEVDRFFRYRGQIYDTHEFVRIVPPGGIDPNPYVFRDHAGELSKWDGIQTDSYFSGIVIRYCDDFERVVVGLALS